MVGNGGGLISKKSCKINELKVQNLVFEFSQLWLPNCLTATLGDEVVIIYG